MKNLSLDQMELIKGGSASCFMAVPFALATVSVLPLGFFIKNSVLLTINCWNS